MSGASVATGRPLLAAKRLLLPDCRVRCSGSGVALETSDFGWVDWNKDIRGGPVMA